MQQFFFKMLHFDLENSLPALLHVEDRVSMAWGLESRVPFINHEIIEFVAKIPENIKINFGNMKYLLKKSYKDLLPDEILYRKDKMGFPVPLNDWINRDKEINNFFFELMDKLKNRNLSYLNISDDFLKEIKNTKKFSRKMWILLNLELWYETFFDIKYN